MAAVFPAQPEPTMMTFRMKFQCYQTSVGCLKTRFGIRLGDKTRSNYLVGDEGAQVSQECHVSELKRRPFPATGFPAHDGDSGHALHGESEENQERHGTAGGELALKALTQSLAARPLDAVDGAE